MVVDSWFGARLERSATSSELPWADMELVVGAKYSLHTAKLSHTRGEVKLAKRSEFFGCLNTILMVGNFLIDEYFGVKVKGSSVGRVSLQLFFFSTILASIGFVGFFDEPDNFALFSAGSSVLPYFFLKSVFTGGVEGKGISLAKKGTPCTISTPFMKLP